MSFKSIIGRRANKEVVGIFWPHVCLDCFLFPIKAREEVDNLFRSRNVGNGEKIFVGAPYYYIYVSSLLRSYIVGQFGMFSMRHLSFTIGQLRSMA
jgi:hypothetical protein